MWKCVICSENLFITQALDIFSHLNRHKNHGELTYPLYCTRRDCNSSVYSIKNYVRHFLHFHSGDFQQVIEDNEIYPNEDLIQMQNANYPNSLSDMDIDSMSEPNDCLSDESSDFNDDGVNDFVLHIRDEAFEIVLNLRAKCGIPYSKTVEIANYFSSFVNLFVNKISILVESSFQELGNTENIKDASKKTIEKLQPLRRVFDDMQSEWKMRKLYERHPRFVSPETVKIGKNRVNNKYNMAQCI